MKTTIESLNVLKEKQLLKVAEELLKEPDGIDRPIDYNSSLLRMNENDFIFLSNYIINKIRTIASKNTKKLFNKLLKIVIKDSKRYPIQNNSVIQVMDINLLEISSSLNTKHTEFIREELSDIKQVPNFSNKKTLIFSITELKEMAQTLKLKFYEKKKDELTTIIGIYLPAINNDINNTLLGRKRLIFRKK